MLIFNFHYVEPVIRVKQRAIYTITPKGLRNFIRALRLAGMKIVSLKTILDDPTSVDLNNDRLCVLTFDDGYENLYEHAIPVLKEQQCPATFFVLGGKFSGVNDWDPVDYEGQARDKLLSLEQMQEMAKTGLIHYGSHGLNHKNMTKISDEEAKEEILTSYDILSQGLGEYFLPLFAYPYGQYTDKSIEIMQQSSYKYAFSTQWGSFTQHSERFVVPRLDLIFRFSNLPAMLYKLMRCKIGIFNLGSTRSNTAAFST